MLSSIYRALIRTNVSSGIRVLNPIPNNLFCVQVQINPFCSSAQKPISETVNQDSFTVNYLINTFGFSPERALTTASKYLKVDSTEKPDFVVAFLKKQCFTIDQINSLVRKFPQVILCDPEKTLLPKIEFFRSLGFSDEEVTTIFLAAPELFHTSLNKQILPSFSYIKSLCESNGTSLASTKRLAKGLRCKLESRLLPNIEILRDAGVPDSKIVFLLRDQPRAFRVNTEKFRKAVEEVKELKYNPSDWNFILGVQAFRAMTKLTWDKKVAVYKKWGWSETDIITAYRKSPQCMMKSTDKITAVMDFIVNKNGLDSSLLLKIPQLFSYSLEKRIKPRFLVYRKLWENGLIKKGSVMRAVFAFTEKAFLKRFVQRYEKEVPELLLLYQKELAVANNTLHIHASAQLTN